MLAASCRELGQAAPMNLGLLSTSRMNKAGADCRVLRHAWIKTCLGSGGDEEPPSTSGTHCVLRRLGANMRLIDL